MFNIIPYPKEIKKIHGVYEGAYKIKKIVSPAVADEGYILRITQEGIEITAKDERGFFYAEQTLLQIKKQYGEKLPCAEIKDAPKYPYRGLSFDCARHFFTVDEIKKQIDVMALLKLNKLHWHITDDQGWRFECESFPNLTETGSHRVKNSESEQRFSGFYTKRDIADIVNYCGERFIEVIPEIDLPGHSGAAIASYPHLSCGGKKIEVPSYYGITPFVVCAGKEETYEFFFKVLEEVCDIFPGGYVHLGGDEALKAHWLDCPDCQQKIKEEGLADEDELQSYFLNRMIKFVNGKGKTAVLWNDALAGENIEGDFAVQYWKESKKCVEYAAREAFKSRKIIWSPFFSLYLDYPHGMTPLKKTYSAEPSPSFAGGLTGMEAALWAEHIDNIEKFEKMVYPRLAATAEKAWNERDLRSFTFRLPYLYAILKEKNINYEIDPNPAFVKGKAAVIKFFLHALKNISKENSVLLAKTAKRMKKKYGKK